MKPIIKLIVFIFTFLTLAASADAQSPREQLQQMVEQLQKTPSDNALREKIIKLGAEIKPAPAIPEEAVRRMAHGARRRGLQERYICGGLSRCGEGV